MHTPLCNGRKPPPLSLRPPPIGIMNSLRGLLQHPQSLPQQPPRIAQILLPSSHAIVWPCPFLTRRSISHRLTVGEFGFLVSSLTISCRCWRYCSRNSSICCSNEGSISRNPEGDSGVNIRCLTKRSSHSDASSEVFVL